MTTERYTMEGQKTTAPAAKTAFRCVVTCLAIAYVT